MEGAEPIERLKLIPTIQLPDLRSLWAQTSTYFPSVCIPSEELPAPIS